ncbi:MAG: hypothetical protein AMJ65_14240 [Phycisphaerae bacterium SG8_4]|nr:MAG: hypothetical protein AMJ65_14240 [Phycisphaerae bacterium SG8_4]
MACTSKNRFKVHRAASISVVALYLFAVLVVSLLHTNGCGLTRSGSAGNGATPREGQCPSCKFLAGHSSTAATYGPALAGVGCIPMTQIGPHSAVLQHDEWAYSIISRAPPSVTIS